MADTAPENSTDLLLAEAARLRALPQFSQAIREYTTGLARFREAPRLINKLTSYETRFRVIGYLLYLHADLEKFGEHGGATYGRLYELCTRRKEVSPRVLKTTLALLRLTGFIKADRDPNDRRTKYYHPTPLMSEFVRQWLSYAVSSLDALEPEAKRIQLLHDGPHFIERFLVSGGRDHADSTPPADTMPEFISFFGRREGAGAVIAAVMLDHFNVAPLPSRASLSRRFGLSKTQITNIIAEGTTSGFFFPSEAGTLKPTEYLRDEFSRWISIELAFYARHMRPA